jgi:hypothetical protein
MRREGAFVIAALLASLAPRANADPTLDGAKSAVDASDYLSARTQLGQLIAKGGNSPEDMGEIYRLSGIVAGALGETKAATEAFQKCLALAPKSTLPPGTSPKITRPFAEAQTYFKTHEPLKIKADTAATPPSVTITVVSDPLEMIARARVIATVDKQAPNTLEKPAASEITVALPAGARIDLRVVALDDKGNRLAEVGSADVPIVIVGSGGAPPVVPAKPPAKIVVETPRSPRPLYLKWWLWGGAAVALAGGATYFAFGARSAKSELDELNAHSVDHDFDEAKSIESRGKRDALLTNIGYGAAGAFAVVSVILFLTEPRASEERRVTTVTPVPIRGGGAVVLGVPF